MVHFHGPLPLSGYAFRPDTSNINRRLPRPEDVSQDHIDATAMGFLKKEKDLEWREVSLVALHPREEIRIVLRENADKYRGIKLVTGLKAQKVPW